MNTSFLYPATLIIVGLLVLVLVIYLTLIIVALRRAGTKLKKLKGRLEKTAAATNPLSGYVNAINGDLEDLLKGVSSVNRHMAGVVRILKLK
jgi:type VI protein secretion system component VasK